MKNPIDEDTLIEYLEELIEGFGIQIRYEPMHQDDESIKLVGGLCRLKGEKVLIINSKATARDKIIALAEAVRHFDIDQVYMRPALREFLEKGYDPVSSSKILP